MLTTRFAPTPSGFLHLGNAFSFALTWLIARQEDGRIVLRIDDLDATRARKEYIEDIFYTLEWLGLDYDKGPEGPGDFRKNYSQQHRIPIYENALHQLAELPEAIFACAMSRSKIQQRSIDGQYPLEGRNQKLSLDRQDSAWRILTPEQQPVQVPDVLSAPQEVDLFEVMRDFVVRRKEGIPAYQISSVVDDRYFGVNFLVRGEDLRDSTAAQLFLAKTLGYEDFLQARFLHHPLIYEAPEIKMSKSEGSLSLQAMRKRWPGPEHFCHWLAGVLELEDPRVETMEEVLAQFKLAELKLSPLTLRVEDFG